MPAGLASPPAATHLRCCIKGMVGVRSTVPHSSGSGAVAKGRLAPFKGSGSSPMRYMIDVRRRPRRGPLSKLRHRL
jgi:hypothetical protein